jgi:hypothetical protein
VSSVRKRCRSNLDLEIQLKRIIIAVFMFLASASSVRAQVDARKLQGAWQVISVKNLRTGAVDTISNRRLIWTQYGRHYWSYMYMDLDRAVTQMADLAKLPAAERVKTDYAKIWNDAGQIRFWAAGGIYWLVGADRHYTNLVSIEPYQVNLGNIETVVRLDDSVYVYRSLPDKEGVQRETYERRISPLTQDAPGSAPRNADLLKGMWQIMSVKNLSTGEVDEIAQRQTIWYQLSDSTWTYIVTDKDRRNTTPAELAALSPEERMRRNYEKIWEPVARSTAKGATDGTRYWASGGKYHVSGDTIKIWRSLSIEPSMVGYYSNEFIVRVDRDTYVYRSAPDAQGVVHEYVHRRLD